MSEEDNGFECSYCGEKFETRKKRDECVAGHFNGTGKIPVRTRKRNQGENILQDMKEEVEER